MVMCDEKGEMIMKAGRELDALIAEKVMGWKKGELNWTIDESWIDSKGSYKWVGKFSPSTNISDAYQVVEKLLKDKLVFIDLLICSYSCKATISTPDGNYEAEAETAPLAICIASLRTKGIDIDE